jgi:hypothetical protein
LELNPTHYSLLIIMDVSDILLKFVEDDESWKRLLIQSQNKYVVDIYLNNNVTYENVLRNKFIIKLANEVSKNIKHIMLLFPNHPDARKRVLHTSDYSEFYKMGKEINARLQVSLNGDVVKMAIVYRDKIYRIQGLQGTAYMLWAERINRETINNQQNTIAEWVPVFLQLDGEMNICHIVVLMEEFVSTTHGKFTLPPLLIKSVSLLMPIGTVLFSCEIDARKEESRSIQTISNLRADTITRDPVVRRMVRGIAGEQLPFNDMEDDSVVASSSDFEDAAALRLTSGTPRVELFVPTPDDLDDEVVGVVRSGNMGDKEEEVELEQINL